MESAPRLAAGRNVLKRIIRGLPFVGDAIVFGVELANPDEADPMQRVRNAVVVGGGGLAASALTGGYDFVPVLAEIAGDAIQNHEDKTGENFPEVPVATDLLKAAPAYNVEHHLRKISYGGIHPESDAVLRKAYGQAPLTDAEKQKEYQEYQNRRNNLRKSQDLMRPQTLIMPRF